MNNFTLVHLPFFIYLYLYGYMAAYGALHAVCTYVSEQKSGVSFSRSLFLIHKYITELIFRIVTGVMIC